jgi:NADPH:quinone reductase-like Zn-dependent oxidoreductase
MVEKIGHQEINDNGIPMEQWAVQMRPEGWQVERVAVPVPASGQVLIKVECAPINPSDTYFLAGIYSSMDEDGKIKYPIAPGWEGAGTVVANGGGIMGWRLVGKRVAVSKCQEPNKAISIGGAYQQYMVTNALQCIPLPDNVSFE